MTLKDGKLKLSNGKGNEPLLLDWHWEMPQTVVIHWTGKQYEAIATYKLYGPFQPEKEEASLEERQVEHSAGIDLGEVHMAVSHDGEHTHILNGRLLRSKRQYQNKLKAKLSAKIDVKKKGSRRSTRLVLSKKKQLKKVKNQMKAIKHQQAEWTAAKTLRRLTKHLREHYPWMQKLAGQFSTRSHEGPGIFDDPSE